MRQNWPAFGFLTAYQPNPAVNKLLAVQTFADTYRELPIPLTDAPDCKISGYSLIGSKTIQEARSTSALQITLTTATGTVRGIPGCVATAVSVMMAYLGTACAVCRAGPVATGMVALFPGKISGPVILRSSQNIVLVGLVSASLDGITIFVNRRALYDIRVDV